MNQFVIETTRSFFPPKNGRGTPHIFDVLLLSTYCFIFLPIAKVQVGVHHQEGVDSRHCLPTLKDTEQHVYILIIESHLFPFHLAKSHIMRMRHKARLRSAMQGAMKCGAEFNISTRRPLVVVVSR